MPPELTGCVFHLRDAVAAGLAAEQLRSACWRRLFRNVYAHVDLALTDAHRFEAVRLAAPDSVATGLTAAWLFRVWTPPPDRPVPLDLAVPRGAKTFTDLATTSRRIVVDEGDIAEFNGVPVTTPERTCFGLMAKSSRTEAVVWADSFLHAGIATSAGLRRYADERPHWPHVRKVRAGVDLARRGAASPMETRLRLVIVDGGLPEPPLLNVPLFGPDGELLGIPDMRYVAPPFGIEYDGAYHRTVSQRAADNVRENRLLLGNMPLLRYNATDVYQFPDRIVREVGTMLRRAA